MHTWTEDGSKAEELHTPAPLSCIHSETGGKISSDTERNCSASQSHLETQLQAHLIEIVSHRFSQETKGNCYLYKIIIQFIILIKRYFLYRESSSGAF